MDIPETPEELSAAILGMKARIIDMEATMSARLMAMQEAFKSILRFSKLDRCVE
jgi:hypothetical protein